MKTIEATFPVDAFDYIPDTGWIVCKETGNRAGTHPDRTCKYRRVSRGGNRVLEHRLAWRLMTGEWPTNEVDHRNLDKSDNRWCNLRLATASENHQNIPNLTNHRGAHWCRTNKRYVVSVSAHGKRYSAYARTWFSAVVAARLIRRVLHGEFSYESSRLTRNAIQA